MASAKVPGTQIELPREWLARAENGPKLIIGTVGMGKSTLLETFAFDLASQLAEDEIGHHYPPLVPLLIPLHRLAERSLDVGEAATKGERLIVKDGSPTSSEVFTTAEIAQLKENRLILLLDGYDELSPCQRLRVLDELKGWNRYILTSRPEHGAEDHFDNENRYAIQPLSQQSCRDYATARLRQFKHPGINEASANAWFQKAIESPSPLGVGMTQPLVLKLWCEYVGDHGRPAERRDQITNSLLRQLFDRRQILQDLQESDHERLSANFERTRESIEDFLGSLGVCFANHDFEPLPFGHPDLPRSEIAGNSGNPTPLDGLRIAERLGLLIRRNDMSLQLLKLPVTEALVGKYLARRTLDQDGTLYFLKVFRRWVWMPTLHNILSEAFIALRDGNPDQSRLATDCCSWLLKISRRCPLHFRKRHSAHPVTARDDLLQPFSLLALRLGATGERTLRAIVAARVRSVRALGERPFEEKERTFATTMSECRFLLKALVSHICEPELSQYGAWLIAGADGQINRFSTTEAFNAARECLDALSRTKNATAESALKHLFRSLVKRVDSDKTEATMYAWLTLLKQCSDEKLRPLLKEAARGLLSSRELSVSPEVRLEEAVAEKDADAREILMSTIYQATWQPLTINSTDDLLESIYEIRDDKDEERSSARYGRLIQSIFCILPEQSIGYINALFVQLRSSRQNRTSALYCNAIWKVASRIPSDMAISVIDTWFDTLSSVKENRLREGIIYAIRGGVHCYDIPDLEKFRLFSRLVETLGEEQNGRCRSILALTIESLCEEMDIRAREVINQLLVAILKQRERKNLPLLYAAIGWTSKKLPPEHAREVATRIHRELDFSIPCSLSSYGAFKNPVQRIPLGEIEVALADWFAEWQQNRRTGIARRFALLMVHAVERMPRASIPKILERFMSAFRRERVSRCRKDLAWLIEKTTGADISPELATGLARQLLELMLKELDRSVFQILADAIRGLISKAPSADLFSLVTCIYPALFNSVLAASEADTIESLRKAVWDVVGRMGLAQILSFSRTVTSCNDQAGIVRLAKLHPQLAVTVASYSKEAGPSFKLENRSDPLLLLDDKDASFAPAAIRNLLVPPAGRDEPDLTVTSKAPPLRRGGSRPPSQEAPEFLRQEDVFRRIGDTLHRHRQLPKDAVQKFSDRIAELKPREQKSRLRRLFFKVLIFLRRSVADDDRKRFVGKRLPNNSLEPMTYNYMHEAAMGSESGGDGRQTFVDGALLDEVLDNSSLEFLEALIATTVGQGPLAAFWKDYDLPAYVCWKCGAAYPVLNESDEQHSPPPPTRANCQICKGELTPTPIEAVSALMCPSDEELFVMPKTEDGQPWESPFRDSSDCCPCSLCRRTQKKLVPATLANRYALQSSKKGSRS